MEKTRIEVLITGGTSGLGKSLTKQFLNNGYNVTALGKSVPATTNADSNLVVHQYDFGKLEEVLKAVDAFASRSRPFDILINNAGILSPPNYQETGDGFELSYQVNFLSHVLLTHLLLDSELLRPGLIVNISSPMYRKGNPDIRHALNKNNYSVLRAYANTKLYMAMLSDKLANEGISGFSFNPGTFSSEIYRMQKRWFHLMYKVAAPFMLSPDKVAEGLFNIVREEKWQDGWMIDRKGTVTQLNGLDVDKKSAFWNQVDEQIRPHMP